MKIDKTMGNLEETVRKLVSLGIDRIVAEEVLTEAYALGNIDGIIEGMTNDRI